MADKELTAADDINNPAHQAQPAELMTGVLAAVVAFCLALVFQEFHPSPR